MMSSLYLLVGFLCLGAAGVAEAGLKICNQTAFTQSVAIGYKADTDWASKGWWVLKPKDCATVVPGDLTQRYFYYFSESEGRDFESQNYAFCTQDKVFTIVGDTDCADRGYTQTRFREIDTGETATDYTLTLVAPGQTRPPITGSAKGPGGGTQSTTETPVEVSVTISPDSLKSDLIPGSFGTAFETGALFQGCELEDGKAFCSFHANGTKLRAYYDDRTPADLLFALEVMDVNTPVLLRADRIETTELLATIIAREVIVRPGQDGDARMRSAMQGDWASDQDPRLNFTVRGSELYPRLSGEFRGARFLQIARSCDGSGGRGPVLVQTRVSDRHKSCFVIDKLEGGVMKLTDARGGARLSYHALR